MTRVKICGITNFHDAIHAVQCGADELGFNFYRESMRYISPDEAHEIIAQLPRSVQSVGVFVNETIDSVLEIADKAGLDMLQIHGDEDREYMTDLGSKTDKPLIRAFRVSGEIDLDDVIACPCNFQLFDTFSTEGYGGTGLTHDWSYLRPHLNKWLARSTYIAGGLTAESVGDVVREVRPFAVDVASGVEAAPGKKDRKKVADFVRNAKGS